MDDILELKTKPSLAIYLPDLSGGGAERLHVRLAPIFVRAGFDVSFLLDRAGGELMPLVPSECRIEVLNAKRQIAALPKIARYLARRRPDVLIANMEHMNVMSVLAKMVARVPTRIIVTQHNAFSEQVKRKSWQFRILPFLYRHVLPHADAVVTVSAGVADDLAALTGLDRAAMSVIYNGVVADDFDLRAKEAPSHPWFQGMDPVIVSMGRFVAQKDFATLIDGFAKIAAKTDARLLLLGDGPLRPALEQQVAAHGLAGRVSMPGFIENPLPYLKMAALFVLSSRFEGFGNVVAEALACGTPVVSTDCPHGPAEILDHGRYGTLVRVGDADALGNAMLKTLQETHDAARLAARGAFFSAENCAAGYVALIARIGQKPRRISTVEAAA